MPIARFRNVLLLVTCLAACSGPDDPVVATAAGRTLTAGSLAALVRGAPPGTDPVEIARSAADAWVDYSLVAAAVADSLDGDDSVLVRLALGPVVRSRVLTQLQDRRATDRPALTRAEVARVYEGDSVRMFQSLLVRVPSWADIPTVQARSARADSIRFLAGRGAPFGELVRRFSETSLAGLGGIGRVVTAPQLPEAYREELWKLAPGAISPILKSDLGFEIVRRPPLAEVRTQLTAAILRSRGARADAAFADSVAEANGLSLSPETAERLRQLLRRPDSLGPDTAWVVAFAGGGLSPREAWEWAATLPDRVRNGLAWAADLDLEAAARVMGRNELLYREARARGVNVDAADLAPVRALFVEQAKRLFAAFRTTPEGTTGPGEGAVDSLLAGVLRGAKPPPIPLGLAAALRGRTRHSIDGAAVVAVGMAERTRRQVLDIGRKPGA